MPSDGIASDGGRRMRRARCLTARLRAGSASATRCAPPACAASAPGRAGRRRTRRASSGVHGARAGDPALAAEGLGDQQHGKCVWPPGAAPAWPACRALSSTIAQHGGVEAAGRSRAVDAVGACRSCAHHARRRAARSQFPLCKRARSAAHNAAMTRRSSRPRAYAPDPGAPGRHCDMPGCGAAGEYRAPKSRRRCTTIGGSAWTTCAPTTPRWDFYKGMTPGEIEAQTARRHRLAAPDLAARPARRGGIDEAIAARSAGHAGRRRPRAEARRRARPRGAAASCASRWPRSAWTGR